MPKVYSSAGEARELDRALGSGGEGEVWKLLERPDLAVKVYHPQVLHAGRIRLRSKVEAMITFKDSMKDMPLAWPLMSVYDKGGEWQGYAMRSGKGRLMQHMTIPPLQRDYFPGLGRIRISQYLINLLKTIEKLHKSGIYLGDINLRNVLVDPSGSEIFLIDCDSMQLCSSGGQIYPCVVGTPDLTAPEHLGRNFGDLIRTRESDAYSLAILIFQCFMLGRHPFDQIEGRAPVDNMKSGHFPYGKTGIRPGEPGGIPAGPWYLQWSWLSGRIKDAFCKTFREGGHDPSKRTSLKEWIDHLDKYIYCINNSAQYGLVDDLRPSTAKPQGGAYNSERV